jgi:hypothetical protein
MSRGASAWPVLFLLAAADCDNPGRDPGASPDGAPLAATTCQPCHAAIVASWSGTAHARTSAAADSLTILGDFSEGQNRLQTRAPNIFFRMDRRDSGFYQTAIDSVARLSRTERFDLVVGSGKIGQTYLYWRDGILYELPVSWLSGAGRWINSPGYVDGMVEFDRVVVPRCLECHATWFTIDTSQGARKARYGSRIQLGAASVWGRSRTRGLYADNRGHGGPCGQPGACRGSNDNCGLCGPRTERPAGSYSRGALDDWFHLPSTDAPARRTATRSRYAANACFRASRR